MRSNGADPHRVLGVPRDATEDEIKRAYRALAKRHHPDAGRGPVDRFLEIQAAYETLLGGGAGATPPGRPAGQPNRPVRRPAQPGRPGTRGGAEGPGTGARAADAGTEWARRPRGGGPRREDRDPHGGTGTAGSGGAAPASGGAAPASGGAAPASGGAAPASGGAAPGSGDPAAGGGSARPARRRRATLGSTSYDEAEEVFEPDWGGASWYGPSSGTYWTINPKEYADPRKHGPEYQARARRRAGGVAGPATDAGPLADADRPVDEEPGRPPGDERTGDGKGVPPGQRQTAARPGSAPDADLPPAWRTQSWTAAAPPGAARPAFEHEPPRGQQPPPARPAPGDGRGPGDPSRRDPENTPRPGSAAPGMAARVALAFLGWLVPGLALAALAGLPGGLLATVPLQIVGVAGLALAPRAAWALAGGGLSLAVAAIPIVAVVTALGGPVVPGGPAPEAAVVLAALAWGAGVLLAGAGRGVAYPWPPGG